MRNSHFLKAFLFMIVFVFFTNLYADSENNKMFIVQINKDGVQRVDIKVDSYSFKPDHLVVKLNKPVEIRLRSVTSIISHNFKLKYMGAGLEVDKDVPSGKDRVVTFTPTKVGKYEFYCDKKNIFANHKKKGMFGILEVVE